MTAQRTSRKKINRLGERRADFLYKLGRHVVLTIRAGRDSRRRRPSPQVVTCHTAVPFGPGTEQIGEIDDPFWITELGERFDRREGAFMDAAAVIANIDLVITSDTAMAQLAGAMGAEVWLALSHAPDWRWMTGGDRSPWYASMRLFRQRAPGDWAAVFSEIAERLEKRAGERGTFRGLKGVKNVGHEPVQYARP